MELKIFLGLIIFCFHSVFSQNLSELIKYQEEKLKDLSKIVTEIYKNRCDSKYLDCSTCLYHSCSFENPKVSCINSFKDELCGTCKLKGRMLSKEFATLMTPPKFKTFSNNDKGFVCPLPKKVNEIFKLNNEDKKMNVTFQYVGFKNGFYFLYPGNMWCAPYDPRGKPWFIFIFVNILIYIFHLYYY